MELNEYLAIFDYPHTEDVISVSWDTASICNYRCSYCDDVYHDGKNRFPPLASVVNFLEDLEKSSGKKLYLEMKGGEPTLWREFDAFLDVCNARQWNVGLVTNGTKPLEWWKTRIALISDVTVSLHPEFYQLEPILEKLEFLHKKRITCVFYLMPPQFFEKAQNDIGALFERVPDIHLQLAVVSIPDSLNTIHTYSPEQQAFIDKINSRRYSHIKRELPPPAFYARSSAQVLQADNTLVDLNPQLLKLAGKNKWSGWMCNAGIDRIHIEVNGDVHRGQCRQGGKLGNIHEGKWTFPKQPVMCTKPSCFCGNELYLKKWNPQKVELLSTATV